jgi:hypothetical protein
VFDLSLPDTADSAPASIARVQRAVEGALEHSVVTMHPLFLGTSQPPSVVSRALSLRVLSST